MSPPSAKSTSRDAKRAAHPDDEPPGEYEILCAELCGVGHHAMRGFVSVDSESDYNEWLSEQMTFKESMESVSLDVNKFAKNK